MGPQHNCPPEFILSAWCPWTCCQIPGLVFTFLCRRNHSIVCKNNFNWKENCLFNICLYIMVCIAERQMIYKKCYDRHKLPVSLTRWMLTFFVYTQCAQGIIHAVSALLRFCWLRFAAGVIHSRPPGKIDWEWDSIITSYVTLSDMDKENPQKEFTKHSE